MNAILILVAVVIVWRLYSSFAHLSAVLEAIPWVGGKGILMSYLLSQINAIRNTPSTLSKAYDKVVPPEITFAIISC